MSAWLENKSLRQAKYQYVKFDVFYHPTVIFCDHKKFPTATSNTSILLENISQKLSLGGSGHGL